jgi:hypothetical protein
MSTTHSLPYTRFIRQVRTEPMALLATAAAAAQAEALLRIAPWVESADAQSTIPARDALRDGAEETFDAYKFCGNYASGYQRAYAGMAAYRFRVPADALTGPDHVVSVALPLHVDRWLVDGARVAAYVSAVAEPSADLATLREGDAYADAELPMEYTEDVPPARIVIDKSKTLTITLPASTDALAYLYVVVSLEDYATVRGFWIEGGAMLVGAEAVTTFDADVTADSVLTEPYWAATSQIGHTTVGTPNVYSNSLLNWFARSVYGAAGLASDNADYIPACIRGALARRSPVASGTPTVIGVSSVWTAAAYERQGFADSLYGLRLFSAFPGQKFTKLGFRAAIPATTGAGRIRLVVYSFPGQPTGVTPSFIPEAATAAVIAADPFWKGTATVYDDSRATYTMTNHLSVLLDPTGHADTTEWAIDLTATGPMTLVYAMHVESIHPPIAATSLNFTPGDIYLR